LPFSRVSIFIKFTMERRNPSAVSSILLQGRILVFPLLFIFLLSACSIEKRHYLGGYNVQRTRTSHLVNTASVNAKDNTSSGDTSNDGDKVTASAGDELVAASINPPPELQSINQQSGVKDSCDLIRLKDGTIIRGRVSKIQESEITYKDCGDTFGPDRVLPIGKIAGITYKNGTEEDPKLFEAKQNDPHSDAKEQKEEKNPRVSIRRQHPQDADQIAANKDLAAKASISSLLAVLFTAIFLGSLIGLYDLAFSAAFLSMALPEILIGVVVISAVLAVIFALRGLIKGSQAKKRILEAEDNYSKKDKSRAVIGIILGILAFIPVVVCLVIGIFIACIILLIRA
jgi:hypothetical protein